MASSKKGSDPLVNFTDKQLSELAQAIDVLDQEEAKIIEEEIENKKIMRYKKQPFRKLQKSPLEIINRLLFFIFLGSFLFSFISIYAANHWWFLLYVISCFSCILYIPNRKALKELIDAWPNIEDLIFNKIKK